VFPAPAQAPAFIGLIMSYQQVEVSECGLVCLAYASSKLGAHQDLIELRRRFPISVRGLSFQQMSDVAGALQMHSRGIRCELEELGELRAPAILHWGLNHFVVLERVTRRWIYLFDPAEGRKRISMADAAKSFTGVAMEISRAPSFERRRERSPLSTWAWIRLSPELYSGLAQVLVLSLMLQAYMIASPFYGQLAIDQAALKGDQALLSTLAIGFGMFGLFNCGASLLRGYATQRLALLLNWDMSVRLFRHLIRLPLPWFQKRRLADTISRFDAVMPIRDLVSGALIATAVDGLLALTTLAMMIIFAWPLACLAVAGALLYVIVALSSVRTSMRLGNEAMTAQIAENGIRIESIRAIQSIKIMAAERAQEAQWSNRFSEVLRKNLLSSRFTIRIVTVQQAIDVATGTLVVYLGAQAIIDAEITVGVLFAFLSYMAQFKTAIANVAGQTIQWRLTDMYNHRLADIVLTPKEDGLDDQRPDDAVLKGAIELDGLGFRYAPHDPFVFKNVFLSVRAGESLAIVGPSGLGKSTLLKVMTGLYPASVGEVRFDGRPISSWGPNGLRRRIGVVLQDDDLLSGSIIDNVTFFAEQTDMARVWEILDAVALKEEILSMPMKGDTFVGDMGGSLSGGQKQRLLLARALYKQPAILFLDEATSHLDAASEAKINDYIKGLQITRVIIAHRQETIRSADRVYDLNSMRFLHQAPSPIQVDQSLSEERMRL